MNATKAIDTLTDSGFTDGQARAVLAVVTGTVDDTACTKLDLVRAVSDIRDQFAPINTVLAGLARDVDALDKALVTVDTNAARNLSATATELRRDITDLRSEVRHDIATIMLEMKSMHAGTITKIVLGLGAYFTLLAAVFKFFG